MFVMDIMRISRQGLAESLPVEWAETVGEFPHDGKAREAYPCGFQLEPAQVRELLAQVGEENIKIWPGSIDIAWPEIPGLPVSAELQARKLGRKALAEPFQSRFRDMAMAQVAEQGQAWAGMYVPAQAEDVEALASAIAKALLAFSEEAEKALKEKAEAEKAEAEEEARERAEAEKRAEAREALKAWARAHGPDWLRAAVVRGYDCLRACLQARAEAELGPEWCVARVSSSFGERVCPSPSAVEMALSIESRGFSPRVMWHRGEEREVVAIRDPWGVTDWLLYRFVED